MIPSISFVILTCNREDHLPKCLKAIKRSTESYFAAPEPSNDEKSEIEIVIIDNSKALTGQRIYEEFVQVPLSISVGRLQVHYLGTSWVPNIISIARNLGLKVSRNPIMVLLDDDVEIHTHYVEKCVSFFRNNPDVAIATGQILEPDTRHLPVDQKLPFGELTKTGDLIANFHQKIGEEERAGRDIIHARGCNFIINKSRFDTYDLFSRHYSMAFEELELCLAVKNRGLRVVAAPGLSVDHNCGVRADPLRKKELLHSSESVKNLTRLYLYTLFSHRPFTALLRTFTRDTGAKTLLSGEWQKFRTVSMPIWIGKFQGFLMWLQGEKASNLPREIQILVDSSKSVEVNAGADLI